jgi:hypothetical protein
MLGRSITITPTSNYGEHDTRHEHSFALSSHPSLTDAVKRAWPGLNQNKALQLVSEKKRAAALGIAAFTLVIIVGLLAHQPRRTALAAVAGSAAFSGLTAKISGATPRTAVLAAAVAVVATAVLYLLLYQSLRMATMLLFR